jgi:histidyl-tRNA synthetase
VKIQALRGMQDLLPDQKEIFRYVEDAAREVFASYGYQELGMPLLESTHLFKRAVGEETDVVEKEMYTFDDRNGESVTLRPEGTAGCVRIGQQHGLLFNQVQRFWYSGPMFRYERPQRGRYRQFEQLGIECFGMSGWDIDAEVLSLSARLWKKLGIDPNVTLELSSLGTSQSRANYREALVEYLNKVKSKLDPDSQRRLETNPLRVLDSKVLETRQLLQDAPLLNDFLDDESKQHHDGLCGLLDEMAIPYVVNPYIVRGLDYYNKTVFEWTTSVLGAQGTVCAGGRYDGLVEQVGGKATPGVGFALGLDRIALMLEENFKHASNADVYVASVGDAARQQALLLAEAVRTDFPGLRTIVHCGDGKFKAQLKRADASGARLALIIGEDEAASHQVSIKSLRDDSDQVTIGRADADEYLKKFFS